jgi:hypothetical protein
MPQSLIDTLKSRFKAENAEKPGKASGKVGGMSLFVRRLVCWALGIPLHATWRDDEEKGVMDSGFLEDLLEDAAEIPGADVARLRELFGLYQRGLELESLDQIDRMQCEWMLGKIAAALHAAGALSFKI